MAGIDKITSVILADADKESAGIISAAEESAKKLIDKAGQDCDNYLAAANDRLDKKLAGENKKTVSQCEQAERLILLKAKQDIIDSMIVKAKAKLLILEKEEYFDNLLKLLEKQAQSEKGVLLLNKKDLDRIPSDFSEKVNQVATKKGGMIDISQDTVDIDGGFILKYGNIEINSSFEALFDENKEELTDIVNNLLW
jgi:V/A-type H+-transporting ATPase subunit E